MPRLSLIPLADVVAALEAAPLVRVGTDTYIDEASLRGILVTLVGTDGPILAGPPASSPPPMGPSLRELRAQAEAESTDDDLARQRASEQQGGVNRWDEDAFMAYQAQQIPQEMNPAERGGGSRREVGPALASGAEPPPPEYDPTPQGPVLPDGS